MDLLSGSKYGSRYKTYIRMAFDLQNVRKRYREMAFICSISHKTETFQSPRVYAYICGIPASVDTPIFYPCFRTEWGTWGYGAHCISLRFVVFCITRIFVYPLRKYVHVNEWVLSCAHIHTELRLLLRMLHSFFISNEIQPNKNNLDFGATPVR